MISAQNCSLWNAITDISPPSILRQPVLNVNPSLQSHRDLINLIIDMEATSVDFKGNEIHVHDYDGDDTNVLHLFLAGNIDHFSFHWLFSTVKSWSSIYAKFQNSLWLFRYLCYCSHPPSYIILYYMIWYDWIWYDMIWYDMIWYDMIWYDMIWYDMIWYDMIG